MSLPSSIHRYRAARHRRAAGRLQRGGTLVELALSFTVLAFLVFGVAEMGFLFHDQAGVANASREAARALAAGDSVTTAKTRATNGTPGLVSSRLSFSFAYSTDSGSTFPSTVTDDTSVTPTSNTAPPGSLIKATVTYTHNYITGILTSKSTTITNVVVMRREQ